MTIRYFYRRLCRLIGAIPTILLGMWQPFLLSRMFVLGLAIGFVITGYGSGTTRWNWKTGHFIAKRSPWNYDDSNEWPNTIAPCGGEHQSPINIDPQMATITDYPRLTFGNYDKAYPETITNNGRTVLLQIRKHKDNETIPFIKDGGLHNRYNFFQAHFHWGSRSGSEHRIAEQQFPAELHIVHYNEKYGNFSEASKQSDGLAVLAILIEMEKRDNIAFRHIEHFDHIVYPGSSSSNLTNPIPLEDLLPDNPYNFYRYNGSLTTPLCNEAVIWTVFETPIALSERQMTEFRQLFDTDGRQLIDNFRPVQSLHDRIVGYRFENSSAGL